MSVQVLPNQINYNENVPSLMPGVNNYTQAVSPSNGNSFSQNTQIVVDLPSRGFIDPKSLYIRYKQSFTVGAGTSTICGVPAYTPIQRLDLFINSSLWDSINDYNKVATDWVNLNLGISDKLGIMSAWGYNDTTGATTKLDGRALTASTTNVFSVAGPLVACPLSGCEKFIPAFAMGGIRLVFTLDSYNNMISNGSTVTDFSITNFEVVYDLVDFGPEVENEILNSQSITLKTNSYNLSSVNVPQSTKGNITFVFYQNYASIRSAILSTASAKSATTVNGKYDSVDITNIGTYGGAYSLSVGSMSYPQAGPLNTVNNRNGILMELRKAVGSLYDWSKSFSIDFNEFGYAENGTTTTDAPGKFFVGFDLNKINSMSNFMLNGTSSKNTPINAVIQINDSATGTSSARNLCLMLNYDMIVTIDPRTKQVSILQ